MTTNDAPEVDCLACIDAAKDSRRESETSLVATIEQVTHYVMMDHDTWKLCDVARQESGGTSFINAIDYRICFARNDEGRRLLSLLTVRAQAGARPYHPPGGSRTDT